MELTFSQTAVPCLRRVVRQLLHQEQTQEIRLPEEQPGIGRVIGAWGQAMIRGKEWRSGSISVSGGVSAWVLYEPEGASGVQVVPAWIPFQFRWDMPETKRDGNIIAAPFLKGMDARSTSGRKLILRADISLMGEALEPVEPMTYMPEDAPEDVQLLRQSYPLELPVEAGEKLFQMEEPLSLPGDKPPISKVLRLQMTPQILEKKVMAGRLVFRGQGNVHMLYQDENERIHCWDTQIPFSHFTDLDREYTQAASAWIQPAIISLELENGQQPLLRCSAAAQYVISDRVMTQLVEDAYSPVREVTLQTQGLSLPMVLDGGCESLRVNGSLPVSAGKVLDSCFMPEYPQLSQDGDFLKITVPGTFTVMYEDPEGKLSCSSARSEESFQIFSDPANDVSEFVLFSANPEYNLLDRSVELSAQMSVESRIFGGQELTMVTQLSLGEASEPDPGRPSLIMRRMGTDRLWDIAKSCGSTVEAIRKANMLKQDPEVDQMLLIPVS